MEELTIHYRQIGVPVNIYDLGAIKARRFSIVDVFSVRYAGFAVGTLENARFTQKKPWNEIMQSISTVRKWYH